MLRTVSTWNRLLLLSAALPSWLLAAHPTGMSTEDGRKGLSPGTSDRIRSHVREEMRLNRIPGVSVAVVRSGEVLFKEAFGVGDLESGEPMSVDTPVELASVSKSFTGLAILRLAEGGDLELDRSVVHYLPDFKPANLEDPRELTVRHLLRHTSGLTRRADRLVPCCGMPGDQDLEVAVRRLRSARLVRPPGVAFVYANTNYALLAAIVQRVTGLPFEDYMEESIFGPLGLKRTTLDPSRAEAWGLAGLHEPQWGRVAPSPSRYVGWLGASSVKAPVRDLAVYIRRLLDPGTPLGRLLREADLCGDGDERSYDFGWEVVLRRDRFDGACLLRHSGLIWGAGTGLLLVPERDLGVAVLLNVGINRAPVIAEALALLAEGEETPVPARVPWFSVPDNWARLFVAGAASTSLAVVLLWVACLRQWSRGERRPRVQVGALGWFRAVLFGLMALYLFYLVAGGGMPPPAGLPTTVALAFPAFAAALGALFTTLLLQTFLPRGSSEAKPPRPEIRPLRLDSMASPH